MAKDRQYPSYFTCVAEILSNSKTPLSVDTLISRIAIKRPVGSGARSAVYQAISKLYQAIPVGAWAFRVALLFAERSILSTSPRP